MSRLFVFLFIVTSLIMVTSCKNTSTQDSTITEVILPNDFQEFLDTFHTDLEFQLAHIQFPLQGLPTMMKESQDELESFLWQKEGWIMHKEFDPDNGEFEQTFTLVSDDMILEKILHLNGKLGLERRYVRSEGSWLMIYYAGMNFIRKDL